MRGWQLVAIVAVTGIASGAAGAMLYSRFMLPAAVRTPTTVLTVERPAAQAPVRVPIVPPGWDPTLVPRLAVVENRLDALRTSSRTESSPTSDAPQLVGDDRTREEKRADHYQQELDYRKDALADHDREPTDNAWAGPQVASMQQSLGKAFDGTAQTKSVDCRSKTCTATLAFPTPSDALVALAQKSQGLTVQGCKGAVAIPTPPANAGVYDLTVLYNCR